MAVRFILWTVLVVLIPTVLVGQNVRKEARNQECKVKNKYTLEDRLKNYPFGTATEIRLVSFSHRPDTTIVEYSLPETNGTVDLSRMTESVTMDKATIDSLTHILFNVGFRGKTLTTEVYMCYSPRNAILFIDSEGKVFEFIELCFECHNNRLSSPIVKTGEFCSDKYNIIKDFFMRQGIKFVSGMGPK
jgi:hypothetical protein